MEYEFSRNTLNPMTIERLFRLLDRPVVAAFIIPLFGLTISALTKLVSLDLRDVVLLPSLKEWVMIFGTLLFLNATLIYVFYWILTRKMHRTSAMEKKVVQAYRRALDQSSLNPHQVNKHHEQLSG